MTVSRPPTLRIGDEVRLHEQMHAELSSQGEQISFKTLQRLRRGYEREGLWALVDHRFSRLSSPTGRLFAALSAEQGDWATTVDGAMHGAAAAGSRLVRVQRCGVYRHRPSDAAVHGRQGRR